MKALHLSSTCKEHIKRSKYITKTMWFKRGGVSVNRVTSLRLIYV